MTACHLVGDKWSVHGTADIALCYSDDQHTGQYTLTRLEARQLAAALIARAAEIEAMRRVHDAEISRAEQVVRECVTLL